MAIYWIVSSRVLPSYRFRSKSLIVTITLLALVTVIEAFESNLYIFYAFYSWLCRVFVTRIKGAAH